MRIQDPIGAAFLWWPRALDILSLQLEAPSQEPPGGPQFEARTPYAPPVRRRGPPARRTEPRVLRMGPCRGP
eukprot:2742545-Alexandrium_andersonii.AAC.1